MSKPHPFDALKEPKQRQIDRPQTSISGEEWDKRLKAHDAALEAASRPRTARQKISDFFVGLISAIFFVGFGLFMGLPELREFVRRVFDQLF